MKYTIRQISEGEDEIIINCHEITPQIQQIIATIKGDSQRLVGHVENEQVSISPEDILYIESVDNKVFAYTSEEVVRIDLTLAKLESMLQGIQFFRCSKSMIINIDKVERLKSLPSNRIDVTIEGGEHVVIARTYASEFRKILKGGAGYERQ